ncbi:MAG: DUF2520 domain-containing protein [Bacteroidales bacterium]|nr:DUF2520 domain-containing protein [Bacteroidales bacterium]
MPIRDHSPQICIVGAGNVAWHLGHALKEKGHKISRIMSRTPEKGEELASSLRAAYSQSFHVPEGSCEILILAIRDDALEKVITQLESTDTLVVHTAGSMSLEYLKNKFPNCGVLYPFQTLSREVPAEFSKVPLCIEASNPETLFEIRKLAVSLSSVVREIDSDQRRKLHLAGILLNNFINHLVVRAEDYLQKQGLEPDIIRPLLHETFEKLSKTEASKAQTGPARRNDRKVIEQHLKLLDDEPELKNLYSTLTDSIIAYYSKV